MATLRAAILTDVHYGFDIKDKLGSKAPRLMRHFAKAVGKFAPDLIVDIGDRVSARSEESDRDYMQRYRAHFNEIAAPLESVLGNHDIRHLSRAENEKIMGNPSSSYTKDVGGYHLVFWNPRIRVDESGIALEKADMDWLKNDLAATDKRVILFSHVPLDNLDGEETAQVTKYFFWTQGEQVRKILEDAGNVALCLHGHRHANRHREINGIHYVTQQSLTSQWKEKYRVPSCTYAFLEANDNTITIRLMGKTRTVYNLELKPAA